jgi:hypothetical protein
MDIGLSEDQAKRQIKNVQIDIVLSQGVSNLTLLTKGGKQDVWCINEEFVTLWLAKISLTPNMQKKNPGAVQKLINYQLKASKVLHEAFMATEEQKQEFYDALGLQGKIVSLENALNENTQELKETKSQLNLLIDNSTINSRQAQRLLHAAKDRVNSMLGGAHSQKYKDYSRMYFKNLWLDFGKRFECSTYKDLNPLHYNDGFTFISRWSMT